MAHRFSTFKRFRSYIVNSYEELKRVVWPTRQQALFLSVVVIGFTVALAIYLAVFDLAFRNGLEKLLQLKV